jgi:hypothetical protein
VGVLRQAHQWRDAAAFHGLPAATHDSGNDGEAARKTQAGRTPAWSAHALRLALRHEAHRHDDAEPLHSLLATSKVYCVGRVPVSYCHAPGPAEVSVMIAARFSEERKRGQECGALHHLAWWNLGCYPPRASCLSEASPRCAPQGLQYFLTAAQAVAAEIIILVTPNLTSGGRSLSISRWNQVQISN